MVPRRHPGRGRFVRCPPGRVEKRRIDLMARTSWRAVSAKNREDPERAARVESGARAMLAISALTQLRESLGLTQTNLASSLAVSQARISQIEHQDDLTLSTL